MADPVSIISVGGSFIATGSALIAGRGGTGAATQLFEQTRATAREGLRERGVEPVVVSPSLILASREIGGRLISRDRLSPGIDPGPGPIPDIEPLPPPPAREGPEVPDVPVVVAAADRGAMVIFEEFPQIRKQAESVFKRVKDLLRRGQTSKAAEAVRGFLKKFPISLTGLVTILTAIGLVELADFVTDVFLGRDSADIQPISRAQIPRKRIPPIRISKGVSPPPPPFSRALLAAIAGGGVLAGRLLSPGGTSVSVAPAPPAPTPAPTPIVPPSPAPPPVLIGGGAGGLATFPAGLIAAGRRQGLTDAQIQAQLARESTARAPATLTQARAECSVRERRDRARAKCQEGFYREFRTGTAFIPWRNIPCR
jgi:hypothetical protein